jgi:hypothetical protein
MDDRPDTSVDIYGIRDLHAYTKDVEQILQELDSSLEGLSTGEVL